MTEKADGCSCDMCGGLMDIDPNCPVHGKKKSKTPTEQYGERLLKTDMVTGKGVKGGSSVGLGMNKTMSHSNKKVLLSSTPPPKDKLVEAQKRADTILSIYTKIVKQKLSICKGLQLAIEAGDKKGFGRGYEDGLSHSKMLKKAKEVSKMIKAQADERREMIEKIDDLFEGEIKDLIIHNGQWVVKEYHKRWQALKKGVGLS